MAALTDKKKTLYVSDLDGTLLGADSQVSDASVAILNELIDHHGLLFTVATARTTATVVPLMQAVHATLPYIVLSGAAMWHPLSQSLQQVQSLDTGLVSDICHIFELHTVHPFVYRCHGNTILAHHYGPLSAVEQEFVDQRNDTPYKLFLLDDAHYHTSSDPTMLVFAMDHGPVLHDIYEQVLATSLPCTPIIYHDNNDPRLGLLEIYAPGCSKAAAIARLARQVGAERVVAFGDNLNDLAMLNAADHAVAVANAVPAVRAAADEVIGANSDDSVARWLLARHQAL